MTTEYAKIRKRLGTGQLHFSQYLGVSKSVLSMVELKERLLPLEASTRFNELKNALATSGEEEYPNALFEKSLQTDVIWTQKRILEIEVQVHELKKTLAFMKREFEAAKSAFRLLDIFKRQNQDRLTEMQINVLDIWIGQNKAKIPLNDVFAQKRIGAAIAALEAELRFLKRG